MVRVSKRAQIALCCIAGSALGLRLLGKLEMETTGLLYIGLPVVIAWTLLAFGRPDPGQSWVVRYKQGALDGLAILLGSAAAVFEGYLCLLFTLPLYFVVLLSVFAIHALLRKVLGEDKAKVAGFSAPLLLFTFALEGTSESLTFDRQQTVFAETSVAASPSYIKQRFSQSFELDHPGFSMLGLFPMPAEVENSAPLIEGSVHRITYRYAGWVFFNVHEGSVELVVAKAGPNYVTVHYRNDDSYISNYLTLQRARLEMRPQSDGTTAVRLYISYRRDLDPAWYFGPLQRFAVRQMAAHILGHMAGGQENV